VGASDALSRRTQRTRSDLAVDGSDYGATYRRLQASRAAKKTTAEYDGRIKRGEPPRHVFRAPRVDPSIRASRVFRNHKNVPVARSE